MASENQTTEVTFTKEDVTKKQLVAGAMGLIVGIVVAFLVTTMAVGSAADSASGSVNNAPAVETNQSAE